MRDEQNLVFDNQNGTLDRRTYLKGAASTVAFGAVASGSTTAAAATDTGYGAGGFGLGGYGSAGKLAVTTDGPSAIDDEAVTLTGTLDGLGGDESVTVFFEWGAAGDDLANQSAAQAMSAAGGFTATVGSLAPATTYEYRAVAVAADGTRTTGATRSVTTHAYVAVTTNQPTGVGESSVTLAGTLDDLGGASSATAFFEWDVAGNGYGNATGGQTLTAPGEFSATLTGLEAATTYEGRAVVAAADGDEVTGLGRGFTTDPFFDVATAPASDVTERSATLNGSVTELGGADSAAVSFEWGPVGSGYLNETGTETVASTGDVATDVDGLQPGTTYEYRVVAAADDGDANRGSRATVTTETSAQAPAVDRLTVTEAGSPNPHAELTAEWEVSDTNGDLAAVATEVFDSSQRRLDRQRTSVDGETAAGTDDFTFKHTGEATFVLRLLVTDSTGATTTHERTVSS